MGCEDGPEWRRGAAADPPPPRAPPPRRSVSDHAKCGGVSITDSVVVFVETALGPMGNWGFWALISSGINARGCILDHI